MFMVSVYTVINDEAAANVGMLALLFVRFMHLCYCQEQPIVSKRTDHPFLVSLI